MVCMSPSSSHSNCPLSMSVTMLLIMLLIPGFLHSKVLTSSELSYCNFEIMVFTSELSYCNNGVYEVVLREGERERERTHLNHNMRGKEKRERGHTSTTTGEEKRRERERERERAHLNHNMRGRERERGHTSTIT